jgi:hypothetical protein
MIDEEDQWLVYLDHISESNIGSIVIALDRMWFGPNTEYQYYCNRKYETQSNGYMTFMRARCRGLPLPLDKSDEIPTTHQFNRASWIYNCRIVGS